MKQLAKRCLALLMAIVMCFSLIPVLGGHAHATASVEYVTVTDSTTNQTCILNWGTRGETATFLSPHAEEFYTGEYTYDELAALANGTVISDNPSCDPMESELYVALSELMRENHVFYTSNYGDSKYDTVYGNTRYWYQYTDCQNNDGVPYCFYTGAALGAWDGGSTWNREHLWPNSKGDGASDKKTIRETDIIMLRPADKFVNSSRGNEAFGESSGYQSPNYKSANGLDMRGDVARTLLYVYVCWGGDEAYNKGALDYMWGTDGVIESAEVLLKWMAADPVDTWEMGRNDSVESITGTRNVFVDYPELAFLLFGEEFPKNWTTPSGEAMSADGHVHNFVLSAITPATCTEAGKQVKTCTVCGDSDETAITATGHNFVGGTCTVCDATCDVMVIYYPAGDLYLTANVSGSKLAGGGMGEAVQFNTTVDANGYYVFESNGKYLTAPTTGNGLSLSATLTDCGRWEVTELDDGCYLRNVGANYNGNHNQYLEYYSVFTTYGFNQENVGIYTFVLKVLEDAETCEHSWIDATCAAPKVCSKCGTKPEPALGHQWTPATCKAPKTCSVCSATEGQKAGHYYVEGVCAVCEVEASGSAASEKTVTVVIEDYKNANGWENNKQYKSLEMDGVITATASGGSNSGKYFTKGASWRFYESDSGKLTITASTASGATIETVKITYSKDSQKKGILTLNGTNISSNQVVTVDGPSVTFGVSHESSSSTGIVYVTAIEVTYAAASGGACDHAETKTVGAWDATCTAAGYTGDKVCSVSTCGVILELGEDIPATGHNWSVPATCTTPETCDNCKGTRGEALGHSYTSEVTREPACNAAGVCTYTCNNSGCDHSYTEDIPATFEHSYEDGACTVCGKADPKACSHDFAPATCTELSKCRLCGDTTGTYAEHTWVDASCKAPKTCSVCKETEGTALEHASIETISGKPATCTEPGLSDGKKCTDCDTVLEAQTEIPAKGHNYVDGTCANPGCGAAEPTGLVAAPVTNVSELRVGKQVIIVAKDFNYALGTTQNNNNRSRVEITKNDNGTITVIEGSGVQLITLEAGNKTGTFAFNVGDGYLYAASSSSNYLRTEKALSDNSSWMITITEEGVATVIAQGANTRNWLRYNDQNALFACYASGQKDIVIYMIDDGGDNCTHEYTSTVTTEAGCTTTGIRTYTCSKCPDSYFEVIPATGHNYVDGKCTNCGEDKPTYGVIEAPIAGVAYKFGMIQKNVSDVDVYYLAGGIQNHYMATTTDKAAAIDVYLEETSGGYYLYTMTNGTKTYINMVVNGTYVNGAYETTASTVYTFDATSKTIIAQINGTPYWFGTRNDNTYTTVGPVKTSYNGFYCQLYGELTGESCEHSYTSAVTTEPTCTVPGVKTYTCTREGCGHRYTESIPTIAHTYVDGVCTVCQAIETEYVTEVSEDFTYKLGLYSTDKDNTYYFTGTMSGYYGATSTDYAKGINVYVEETTGGYYLYFIDNSNFKQYINLVTSGTHRNFTFGETAISVFVWDTELNALYTTVKDEICYMGTYGSYVTMGVLQSSKLSDGDYIARLYVMGGDVEVCTHTNTTALPGKDATCTETGLTEGSKCVDCGRVLVAQTRVPAKGHSFENGYCSVCGEAEHHYTTTVVSEPTCETTGAILYACDDCLESYIVITKAAGHKLSDGVCTVCGKVFAEDGSSVTVTDEAVEVVLSKDALSAEGGVVALPIPEVTVSGSEAAPTITIDLSNNKTESAIKVEIPVAEVTESTVIVIVHEDGTEEIVQKTALTEKGLVFEAEENVTVKVIDNSKEFVDVDPEGWSSKAIDFASSREILNGMGNDVFSPKTNMTRGQLAVMLYNLESKPEVDLNSTFTDANGTWYTEAVEWAAAEQIVMGNTDGTFGGEKDMTREQMVTFLYRYAGSPKVTSSAKFNSFSDCASVSDWAVDAMSWAIEMGIINGVGNNTIDPSGTATREQVAQILMNFLNAQ